jgi:hypothetical protein
MARSTAFQLNQCGAGPQRDAAAGARARRFCLPGPRARDDGAPTRTARTRPSQGIPATPRLLLVLPDDQPGTSRCWTCKRRTTSHLAGRRSAGRPGETNWRTEYVRGCVALRLGVGWQGLRVCRADAG